jgi:hypothetical protein
MLGMGFLGHTWEIVLIVVGLLSGAISVLREVQLMYFPAKAEGKKLFWGFARIAFVIAAILLWSNEHDKVSQLAALKSEKPTFNVPPAQVVVIPPSQPTSERSMDRGPAVHELKLAFIDSPTLTTIRRTRIAAEMDRIYHRFTSLGLAAPTEAYDHTRYQYSPITVGIARKGQISIFLFDPTSPLLIQEDSVDNLAEAADAYAEFVVGSMLPDTDYVRRGKNEIGAFDIGTPEWTARQLNRSLTVIILSSYFVRTFYGKPPAKIEGKYIQKWTSALSEIYKKCDHTFVDDVLVAALQSPEQPLSMAWNDPNGSEDFDRYFLRRFRSGESTATTDDGNRARADSVLKDLGLKL